MAHKGTKAKVLTRKVSYSWSPLAALGANGLAVAACARKVITNAGGPESRHLQVS